MTAIGELLNGLVLGVHLVSAHSTGGANNDNPGLYLRTEAGLTAGYYWNSKDRVTSYAGWTWQSESRTWSVSLVAASGYGNDDPAAGPRMPRIVALPMFSARVPLGRDAAVRFGYVPKPPGSDAAHTAHLMVEWRR
jgi:hypothetical protein